MRSTLSVLTLCSAVLLAGCQAYTLAPANQPIEVAGQLQVTPSIDWSRQTFDNMEIWTVDGPALENMTFYAGIENDKPLPVFPVLRVGHADNKWPTFRSTMDALEVADLVRDTYDRAGHQQFAYDNLRPETFGDVKGFRFEFSFVTESGLEKQGMAHGAIVDDKLHIAIYTGTKEYYYDQYKSAVESALATLRLQASGEST